jgi:SAM-dependent methyltransferase
MSLPARETAYGQDGLSWADRLGVRLSRRPVQRVVHRYIQPTVLDLGCGYDAVLLRSLTGIQSGVGVDLHVSDAAKASGGLSFIEQPIEQALPAFEPAQFDVILLISVLEHLWDAPGTLAACRRLLKPGGSLVINVPNWLGKRALEFAAFRLGLVQANEMDDHKMYYAKRDLWPLLVRAGFRPSRIRMRYHKLALNLFAVAVAGEADER